ncbi:MAG: helix-turn-helix domain-containing protein [Lacunisphaera sp.]
MQTIGERLEEARKRKGISVREAAESTKIRGDYLQKFEANSFDIDLPPLYIRGFIRTYARFLELDPERIVSDEDTVLAREGKQPARREHREALGRVDFCHGEPAGRGWRTHRETKGRSARDQATLIKYGLLGGGALALIVVIVLLVNVLSSRSAAKTAAKLPEPAPASVQAETTQTLVLTAVEAARVKVVRDLDGTELFQGSLARGESKTSRNPGNSPSPWNPARTCAWR